MISQGSTAAPLAKEGQQLLSNEPVETDAIMASLLVTALNAEVISGQLAEIMSKINSGRRYSRKTNSGYNDCPES